jgi:DNA polymerase-3 subunit gamma/tau
LLRRVRALVEQPDFGHDGGESLLFAGPSGTGKTTLAWLIAKALGADKWSITELDGEACGVDAVRRVANTIELGAWGDSSAWRVWIVNECHEIAPKAVQAFLTLLEGLPERRLFMFTTTKDIEAGLFGDFTEPFASRCKVFAFTNQGLAQSFAAKARQIAEAEGLNGKPESAYLRLVQDCHNNMRRVLQRIGSREMME